MEPTLVVDESLVPILEELKRLEPLFHSIPADMRSSQFEEMVAEEFWEVGASGRRYSREFVLDILRSREQGKSEKEWETSGFHVLEIAADNYLLTYTLHQPDRVTRRATLWRNVAGVWKAVYHQGTVVQMAIQITQNQYG